MAITAYNTLTKQKQALEPDDDKRIGIYACGVTTYDVCHVGHAMQAMIYDVIRNYLCFRGYDVRYVRNYTDVDDKIIARAAELGIDPMAHSENVIADTERDLKLLDIAPADIQPRVSENIPEIVALIERLIERGHAYESEGDVYFNVRSYSDYGQLSNRNIEDLRSGARIEVRDHKQDPLDFALWKSAKPGEISWPSPWGEGRPGWHIECSALAVKYLGDSFAIHGGGKDLIFPHHENEIAQSVCGTDGSFAKCWIHNGLVTVAGRKMSKSLDNFLSIQDAISLYHPEVLRFSILKSHYAAEVDFSQQSFHDAYQRLIYFYTTLSKVDALAKSTPDVPQTVPEGVARPSLIEAFTQAMDDDFNSARALSELGTAFKFVNDLMCAKKPKMKQKLFLLTQTVADIRTCAAVLRLLTRTPATALIEIREYLVRQRKLDTQDIERKIAERTQARCDKDFTKADALRDELAQMGVQLMDSPDGTDWQVSPCLEAG